MTLFSWYSENNDEREAKGDNKMWPEAKVRPQPKSLNLIEQNKDEKQSLPFLDSLIPPSKI